MHVYVKQKMYNVCLVSEKYRYVCIFILYYYTSFDFLDLLKVEDELQRNMTRL